MNRSHQLYIVKNKTLLNKKGEDLTMIEKITPIFKTTHALGEIFWKWYLETMPSALDFLVTVYKVWYLF